jgi:hypothetical protein
LDTGEAGAGRLAFNKVKETYSRWVTKYRGAAGQGPADVRILQKKDEILHPRDWERF